MGFENKTFVLSSLTLLTKIYPKIPPEKKVGQILLGHLSPPSSLSKNIRQWPS